MTVTQNASTWSLSDACVEIGADDLLWRTAAASQANSNCVEVARLPHAVHMRDSKDPDGGELCFTLPAFRGFIADVHAGRFDRPAR